MIARGLTLFVALALAGVLAGEADAVPGHTPPIGGPPPFPVEEILPGLRPSELPGGFFPKRTGPEILLGVGHRSRLEIVGYRTAKSACIFVASQQVRSSGGSCGKVDFAPPEGHSLLITSTDGVTVEGGERLSQVQGQLAPDVAAVRLRYRVQGHLRHSRAVVAQVQGHLQRALGVNRPFGRFAATFHGCSSRTVVTALGAGGEVLESTTIAGDLIHLHVPCKGNGGSIGAVKIEPSS